MVMLEKGDAAEEDKQVQLISLAPSLDKSQVRNLEREDFHYWGMIVPKFLDSKS